MTRSAGSITRRPSASSRRRPAPAASSSSTTCSAAGSPAQQDRSRSGPRQPATRVHVDHTAQSGPQRVRDLMADEAEELLKGRVQVINLWRPIRGPLRDAPLAVCDARTVDPDDLVPSDLVYRERVGETYSVTLQPGASLVLRAGDAARRGAALEDRGYPDRRPGPLHAAHGVHRPDDAGGRVPAREHRAAHAGVPPGIGALAGVISQITGARDCTPGTARHGEPSGGVAMTGESCQCNAARSRDGAGRGLGSGAIVNSRPPQQRETRSCQPISQTRRSTFCSPAPASL